ncbi:MAG TPA: undecaprenyl-diphosphatase UppP [Roseiflexaceae bacterium]|nr:undecaprenyl-diphosphatase UppP [Roseiflexaceae bacterium]
MHDTRPGSPARAAGSVARPTVAVLAALTLLGCLALAAAGFVQPVVLGVVQGLGEFLPISSSAHLILVPWLFGWADHGLTFDVALHLGTLVAVVGYFWRDLLGLLRALPGAARWTLGPRSVPPTPRTRLLIGIAIGTVPAALLGLLLEETVESVLRSQYLVIAATLTVMGVLLYVADRRAPQRKVLDELTWRDALLIGLAQACALIPGVSRSGATMTMGRFLALDRAAAARFSFLLSTPITAAAFLGKLDDLLLVRAAELPAFVVGVVVSGVVGALSIHFLLGYIRQVGFGVFAVYRIMLAALIVTLYLARG